MLKQNEDPGRWSEQNSFTKTSGARRECGTHCYEGWNGGMVLKITEIPISALTECDKRGRVHHNKSRIPPKFHLKESPPLPVSSKQPQATMSTKKGEFTQTRLLWNQTHQVKAEPQKHGVKGYFTGLRLKFLTSHCDEYAALRGKSHQAFWFKVFNEYWVRYPWRLPDHEEPPADDPKKMEELAYVGEDEKDQEKKAVVEEVLCDVSSFNSKL